MSDSNDLLNALTQLVKVGMAFTSEESQDGATQYVIDSVRLSEAEVILLHSKHALTRDGIRRYLVDRAA